MSDVGYGEFKKAINEPRKQFVIDTIVRTVIGRVYECHTAEECLERAKKDGHEIVGVPREYQGPKQRY